MLKIINDAGEIVYEFNDSGYFGIISNAFLMELASGKFTRSEAQAICFLMSTAAWDSRVDMNVSRGAKATGVSGKAYREILTRLIEKKLILKDAEHLFFNPTLFRRRAMWKKTPYKKLDNNILKEDKSKQEFE
jgi:hypothetical protein